jgi:stage V sporulation protein D (sporulation-specific penicillin-binding protein)
MPGMSIKAKKRQLIVLLIFLFLLLLLLARTFYWQIIEGKRLSQLAYENQTLGRTISPKRGTIYDRNGKELAISASVDTVWVNPKMVSNSEMPLSSIATGLASILDLNAESVLKKISKNTTYDTIIRKIEREVGDQIRLFIQENDIVGIYVEEDSKRYYPHGNLASHMIGFTGDENQGLEGLEAILERYLKGVPGKIISEVDAGGEEIPLNVEKRIDPQNGLDVVLTIDYTIQYLAEKALDKAILDNDIKRGATAIVMDPRNGDILAMASKPDFNLNDPFALPDERWLADETTRANWVGTTSEQVNILRETIWRNKALIDTYEPGSTFKAITSAAGLEDGKIKPDSEVSDYPVELAGFKLECWRYYSLHGRETFRQGVYNSCNPVFVRVAQDLGVKRFYEYLRAFGFYDKTGILLPEAGSIIHSKPQEIDMAVASFGQSFQITPIQLISAYSAIANEGVLMKPRIVKELRDQEGNIVEKYEPEEVRHVISKQTCDTLLDILEGVVSEGTGKNAYVTGYRVAGKTGTSQTIPRTSGRYIASFAAIAPADNPRICILVTLDDPKGFSHMGGVIAAPVAGTLAEEILTYLNVERRYTERDKEVMKISVYVPEVRNMTVTEAVSALRAKGLNYRVESGGASASNDAVVLEQTPKPGANIPEKSQIILYTYKPEEEIMVKVPDVLDMTVAEATNILSSAGLNIKINGLGIAINQVKAAGEMVPKGSLVEVEFVYLDNVE